MFWLWRARAKLRPERPAPMIAMGFVEAMLVEMRLKVWESDEDCCLVGLVGSDDLFVSHYFWRATATYT